MEKIPFYKTKKFWALIVAVVTALSAYFVVGCTAQFVTRTRGVHIDTIDRQICTHSKNHPSNELHW